jgi:hypothetical protein
MLKNTIVLVTFPFDDFSVRHRFVSRSAKHDVPHCTTSPAPDFFNALIGQIHVLIAIR